MASDKAVVNTYPHHLDWNTGERRPVHSEIAPGAVLVVDALDSSRGYLRDLLEGDGYRVLTARQGSDALEILENGSVDLVILDMFLPDMDGAELCRRIRGDRHTGLTPVLLLSLAHEIEDEVSGIAAGADAFLGRPFHPEIFGARVRSMLRRKALVAQMEEPEAILFALTRAVELRDPHTAVHCDRLAALAVATGMTMGLPASQLLALHHGGYLHDIGKIAVPDSVLFKKGPLDEDEWAIMRTHTIIGEAICRPIKCLGPVLPIIRNHHERWDGSGYPDGLAGENIPLLARVLQMADIYDALTSERCYKAAMGSAEALRVMREETDRGWHDPELMRIFLILRHEAVREASDINAESWLNLQVMRQSLENLRVSLMRP